MSDGMSDSRAETDLAQDVWREAFDLAGNSLRLARAVERAGIGHRGWAVARSWIVAEVNRCLRDTGFILVDHDPEKACEHYREAYKRQPTWRELDLERQLAELRGERP